MQDAHRQIINQCRELAGRQLDGMTINRQTLANKVLDLCNIAENLDARGDRLYQALQEAEKKQVHVHAPQGGFAGDMGNIFGDIFGGAARR